VIEVSFGAAYSPEPLILIPADEAVKDTFVILAIS
jgi:hypothetical protein